MRVDLAYTAVGVSVLCPGFVHTGIFDSERNRPEALHHGDPSGPAGPPDPAQIAKRIDGVPSADRVAGQVIDAVREERFWIFTHPGSVEHVKLRAQAMGDALPPPRPSSWPAAAHSAGPGWARQAARAGGGMASAAPPHRAVIAAR